MNLISLCICIPSVAYRKQLESWSLAQREATAWHYCKSNWGSFRLQLLIRQAVDHKYGKIALSFKIFQWISLKFGLNSFPVRVIRPLDSGLIPHLHDQTNIEQTSSKHCTSSLSQLHRVNGVLVCCLVLDEKWKINKHDKIKSRKSENIRPPVTTFGWPHKVWKNQISCERSTFQEYLMCHLFFAEKIKGLDVFYAM